MAKEQAAGRASVRRREKKNITSGVAHVNASFNNTMITITDAQGNTIAWSSSVTKGNCLTTRAFIHLKEEKKRLFSTYNARVIDMESAPLAEVFCSEKIPFINIRIISDTADHDVIDMNLLHEIKNSSGMPGLILHFIKNPKEIIHAWKLRKSLNRVSIQIREIAETLVREL